MTNSAGTNAGAGRGTIGEKPSQRREELGNVYQAAFLPVRSAEGNCAISSGFVQEQFSIFFICWRASRLAPRSSLHTEADAGDVIVKWLGAAEVGHLGFEPRDDIGRPAVSAQEFLEAALAELLAAFVAAFADAVGVQ